MIFHPIIAPYRIDFFNSLSEEFDTTVCLTWRNLHDQTFDYKKIESQFKFRPIYLDKRFLKVIPQGVLAQLRVSKPDYVLVPECGIISITVLLYRWLTRSKFKIISMIDDSYDLVSGHQFSKKHALAEQLLIPRFDNIINVDPRTVDVFQRLYSKGIFFPIISEGEHARQRYERIIPLSEHFIHKYNLEGLKVILFVGRMVKIKNVQGLIATFKRLDDEKLRLVLVGSGEYQATLEKLACDDVRIIFPGRFEGDELYAWYNIASLFCLPSLQEPFGAVTNEALLAGCYSLVSEKAGSQCLVDDGINGYVFNPLEMNGMYAALKKAIQEVKNINLPLQLRQNRMKYNFHDEFKRLVNQLQYESIH